MYPTPVEQSNPALNRHLELAEAGYWSALYPPFYDPAFARLGAAPRWFGDAFAGALAHIDILAFNRVTGLGMEQKITVDQLDDIIAHYRKAGVRRFFVQLSPNALPPEAGEIIESKGFQLYNHWAKLYRPLREAVPPLRSNLRITEVKDYEGDEYGRLLCRAFQWPETLVPLFAQTIGWPGYQQYFVREGKTVIAAGALYQCQDIACLAIAGTLPEHRGKGAQRLLLNHRVREAYRSGCRHLIGETAENRPDRPVTSYRNMQRAGMQLVYLRPNYLYQFEKQS